MVGLAAAVVIIALFAASAFSQTSGRISGTVKDMTGAVIPQSRVTATNVATGVKVSTASNEAGAYFFPLLGIGTYSIEATASGFQSEKRDAIKIDVNTSLTIDFSLHVADNSETVEVNAGAVEVEATDTQLGQTIEFKQVTEIPLNGRSYTDLLAVQAGVAPITTSGAGNSTSGGGFGTVPVAGEQNTGQFSIHGQRESDNAFYLNGGAGVEMMYFNSFAVGTNPFSLGQVNDNYDLSEDVFKTLGSHTIKFGGRYIWLKVKQAPNLVANGTFSFFGSGSQSTGNGYADFLLGLPDFYSQQSSPNFYESSVSSSSEDPHLRVETILRLPEARRRS